jgi:Na+-transporting NADH:ubiquinone oxidoreductase subunit NqrB
VLGDPRILQIVFLAGLVTFGAWLPGVVPAWEPPLTLASACLVQAIALRVLRLRGVGFRSALVTGLGVAVLLRSDRAWVPPLAAAAAIASKFVLRDPRAGKHLWNPANFGVIGAIAVTSHAWVSPSQWGNEVVRAAWIAAAGCAVAHRAFRADVSVAFLGTLAALKAARVIYLGQPLAVLPHQLASGSLLVFTFFMISDPRTTPDARAARIGFGVAVAALGQVLQQVYWNPIGPLWALAALTPVVPFLDRVWPAFSLPERSLACVASSPPPSPQA